MFKEKYCKEEGANDFNEGRICVPQLNQRILAFLENDPEKTSQIIAWYHQGYTAARDKEFSSADIKAKSDKNLQSAYFELNCNHNGIHVRLSKNVPAMSTQLVFHLAKMSSDERNKIVQVFFSTAMIYLSGDGQKIVDDHQTSKLLDDLKK